MFENEHTRSAREYTMLLRNWWQQQPSNQSDIDWRVAREVGKFNYTERTTSVRWLFTLLSKRNTL
jgi:hypothetical protein